MNYKDLIKKGNLNCKEFCEGLDWFLKTFGTDDIEPKSVHPRVPKKKWTEWLNDNGFPEKEETFKLGDVVEVSNGDGWYPFYLVRHGDRNDVILSPTDVSGVRNGVHWSSDVKIVRVQFLERITKYEILKMLGEDDSIKIRKIGKIELSIKEG